MPTPQESTAASNAAFGKHPGSRALHAKGTLLKGTFTATPEAKTLTKAAHMQGDPVPVTVRVSNGAGNPKLPDYAPDVRGFAVKFYLPDGSKTDIVAQTAPRFPFSEPGPFLELLRIQGAGPAGALKLPLFLARNPKAVPIIAASAPRLRPPTSYATIPYYALHSYKWIGADGTERYVRYTLLPEHTEKLLAPWQARKLDRDYLKQDIVERVTNGIVSFKLEVQIATPGDNVDDPSAPWPSGRRRVNVGTIKLDGLDTEREQGDDILVFDPGREVDGIELSNDPVLRFRTPAYSDSVAQRTNSQ